jgi:hypothetical protein
LLAGFDRPLTEQSHFNPDAFGGRHRVSKNKARKIMNTVEKRVEFQAEGWHPEILLGRQQLK